MVGSSIKLRTTADVAVDALTIAWFRHKPAPGLIHHSDRGSQYASGLLQEKLVEFGMICSMCHRGNCWDNAPTESFFNSLRTNWCTALATTRTTRRAPRADLFDYIEVFYNRSRRHSTLGYQSPTQFMLHWIATQVVRKLGGLRPYPC